MNMPQENMLRDMLNESERRCALLENELTKRRKKNETIISSCNTDSK